MNRTPGGIAVCVVVGALVLAGCDAAGSGGSSPGADAADEVGGDAAGDVALPDGSDGVADVPLEVTVDVGPVEIPTGPLGGDRPAALFVPSDYDPATPWPLVMLLHGFTASGSVQDLYFQVSARVDELGFVFVLPDGTTDPDGAQFWNATPACCNFYGSPVDDVAYLSGLIEEAKSLLHIDAQRVVLIGHSNGGFMAHRMACDRADLVTGIASLAGSTVRLDTACVPSDPVTVLQMHGTMDTTIPYDGQPFQGLYSYPGAEDIVARWKAYNGCTGGPVDHGYANYDGNVAGDETHAISWDGCGGDREVRLWKMEGSGHIPVVNADFITDILDLLLGTPRSMD